MATLARSGGKRLRKIHFPGLIRWRAPPGLRPEGVLASRKALAARWQGLGDIPLPFPWFGGQSCVLGQMKPSGGHGKRRVETETMGMSSGTGVWNGATASGWDARGRFGSAGVGKAKGCLVVGLLRMAVPGRLRLCRRSPDGGCWLGLGRGWRHALRMPR
jgi:hypothetical protein